jgi:hypothetical protein
VASLYSVSIVSTIRQDSKWAKLAGLFGLTFEIELDTLELNQNLSFCLLISLMPGPGASRRKVICPFVLVETG